MSPPSRWMRRTALAALLLAPAAVLAAPILTLDGRVEARPRVPAGSVVDTDSSRLTAGAVAGSVSDARTAEAVGSIGAAETSAAASFEGTATFGELRGSATARAIGGSAASQLVLRFDDEFVATSNVLAFGSAVDYLVTLSLDSGILTSETCAPGQTPGPGVASLSANGGAGGIVVDRACPGPPDDRVVRTVVHTTIGALVPISAELSVGASVGSSVSSLPNVFAVVDASHTGRFFLDPVGPDHSYRTSSGVTYFSPVPEPALALLLGFGVVASGYRAQRDSARR